MFEKEAEKWVSNNFKLYLREPSIVVAKHAFKDGAEFGYNKANEWHRGSEHPNHNHEVLCILWGSTKEVGYYENNVWYFEAFTADDEDVDYWKEIVLPKESE